jgi:glycosyltransferase involved in cell wall biosynthesis
MAAGVPVVADDVGQNGEYIEHDTSGLLVPTGQTDAFARSVVELLRDKSFREKLARGARKRISGEFDWGNLVTRVEEAYGGKPREGAEGK